MSLETSKMSAKETAEQGTKIKDIPKWSKYESLTAQLKDGVIEKMDNENPPKLSDGEPKYPQEKTSAQGGDQLAKDAFERLMSQASRLQKETSERPDPTLRNRANLKGGS